MKLLLKIFIASLLLSLVFLDYQFVPNSLKLKTTSDKVAKLSETSKEVKYIYATDQVVKDQPLTLKPDEMQAALSGQSIKKVYDSFPEIVKAREGNARFYKLAETNDKKTVVQGVFYSGQPFVHDAMRHIWYKTAIATTTPEAFAEQTHEEHFLNFKIAQANSSTFNPQTSGGEATYLRTAMPDTPGRLPMPQLMIRQAVQRQKPPVYLTGAGKIAFLQVVFTLAAE